MLIVQKFGGTSVGSIDRIRNVARLVLDHKSRGDDVVVVVSAMAGETNRLVDLARQLTSEPWSREYDMLLASGEQISIALLALAINTLGGKACPLLGYQLGIQTDNAFSKARIQAIKTDRITSLMEEGSIPVIAGFQGVDADNNITTLGRGGSDTSAVAIAAALGADDCEIYTDVDGVYTTDPRLCSSARKLEEVCYDEMMELASLGAKVLQIRSVELAAKYAVPLHVRSSFNLVPGTRVVGRKRSMENITVTGIAADANDGRISLVGLPDEPAALTLVFGSVAKAGVLVDVIVRDRIESGKSSLSFTVPEVEMPRTLTLLEEVVKSRYPSVQISSESGVAKVSVVGVGMRSHPGVAAKTFEVLANADIPTKLISTSEIKISVLIDRAHMSLAVEKLHSAFNLDKL